MKKIFFGGSRNIARLNAVVRKRVDNVISNGFAVLIGDANGADRAFQKYLADKKYSNVTVFCAGQACRNNIGRWKTHFVFSNRAKKDFEHYAKKDAEMGREAEYGLFLWDGRSKGTLSNIFRLISQEKKALVYFSPAKDFIQIRSTKDLEGLLIYCDPGIADSVRRRLSESRTEKSQSQLDLA